MSIIFDLYADGKHMDRHHVGERGLSLAQWFKSCDRWFDKYGDRMEICMFEHNLDDLCNVIEEHFRWEKQQAWEAKFGGTDLDGRGKNLTTLKPESDQLLLLS